MSFSSSTAYRRDLTARTSRSAREPVDRLARPTAPRDGPGPVGHAPNRGRSSVDVPAPSRSARPPGAAALEQDVGAPTAQDHEPVAVRAQAAVPAGRLATPDDQPVVVAVPSSRTDRAVERGREAADRQRVAELGEPAAAQPDR